MEGEAFSRMGCLEIELIFCCCCCWTMRYMFVICPSLFGIYWRQLAAVGSLAGFFFIWALIH
jgi:hypothetical protein